MNTRLARLLAALLVLPATAATLAADTAPPGYPDLLERIHDDAHNPEARYVARIHHELDADGARLRRTIDCTDAGGTPVLRVELDMEVDPPRLLSSRIDNLVHGYSETIDCDAGHCRLVHRDANTVFDETSIECAHGCFTAEMAPDLIQQNWTRFTKDKRAKSFDLIVGALNRKLSIEISPGRRAQLDGRELWVFSMRPEFFVFRLLSQPTLVYTADTLPLQLVAVETEKNFGERGASAIRRFSRYEPLPANAP